MRPRAARVSNGISALQYCVGKRSGVVWCTTNRTPIPLRFVISHIPSAECPRSLVVICHDLDIFLRKDHVWLIHVITKEIGHPFYMR